MTIRNAKIIAVILFLTTGCHSGFEAANSAAGNSLAFGKPPHLANGASAASDPGYDVIIIGGQSNAVGVGRGSFSDPLKSTTVDNRVFQIGRTVHFLASSTQETSETCVNHEGLIVPATDDGLEHWYNCPGQGNAGFGMAFARRWVINNLGTGRNVLIVPGAMGGTTLNQWANPSVLNPHGVNLLDDLGARTSLALAAQGPNGETLHNRVVAILWSQGEGDITDCAAFLMGYPYCNYPSGDMANLWGGETADLFQQLRDNFNDVTGDIPVVAIGFVPTWNQWEIGSNFTNLSTEIQAFSASLAYVQTWYPAFHVADVSGLDSDADINSVLYGSGIAADYAYDESHVHYNGASQIALGDRLYSAFGYAWQSKVQQALLSPSVFDWQAYLALNPGLVAAGVNNEALAKEHWQLYGAAEGLQANGSFNSQTYLATYSDVRASCGTNTVCAILNYIWYGLSAQRYALPSSLTFGGLRPSTTGLNGDAVIGNPVLKITTSSQYGGAINGLYYGGRQFVNDVDHGRQIQVSTFNDGWGECENPTEAGARNDGTSASTTTQFLGIAANASFLWTYVDPAYWLAPGQTSSSCGNGNGQRPNVTVSTDMTFSKKSNSRRSGIGRSFKCNSTLRSGESLISSSLTPSMPT